MKNRFLTLSGGAWSEKHPKRATSLIAASSTLAPAAVISLSSLFNQNAPLARDLIGSFIASLIGLGMMMGVRHLQRGILNSVAPNHVIDTQPEQGKRNNDEIKAHANAGTQAITVGPTTIMMAACTAAILLYPFFAEDKEGRGMAILGGLGLTGLICQWERRNQLASLATDKYVLVSAPTAKPL